MQSRLYHTLVIVEENDDLFTIPWLCLCFTIAYILYWNRTSVVSFIAHLITPFWSLLRFWLSFKIQCESFILELMSTWIISKQIYLLVAPYIKCTGCEYMYYTFLYSSSFPGPKFLYQNPYMIPKTVKPVVMTTKHLLAVDERCAGIYLFWHRFNTRLCIESRLIASGLGSLDIS